jgi:hypothetical protein
MRTPARFIAYKLNHVHFERYAFGFLKQHFKMKLVNNKPKMSNLQPLRENSACSQCLLSAFGGVSKAI